MTAYALALVPLYAVPVSLISYALLFMNDAALRYLQNSQGWAIGSGPAAWSSLIRRRGQPDAQDIDAGRLCGSFSSKRPDGRHWT